MTSGVLEAHHANTDLEKRLKGNSFPFSSLALATELTFLSERIS
jgi:hypothetical protein